MRKNRVNQLKNQKLVEQIESNLHIKEDFLTERAIKNYNNQDIAETLIEQQQPHQKGIKIYVPEIETPDWK